MIRYIIRYHLKKTLRCILHVEANYVGSVAKLLFKKLINTTQDNYTD